MYNGDHNFITVRNKILRAGTMILIICLFAVFLRLHLLSMHYYQQANTLRTSGDTTEAVHYYCWTVRHYYPGNTFSQNAIEQTIAIADGYHADNELKQELLTLQKLRAAIFSIQSYFQPFSNTLQSLNNRIDSLEIPSPDIPAE